MSTTPVLPNTCITDTGELPIGSFVLAGEGEPHDGTTQVTFLPCRDINTPVVEEVDCVANPETVVCMGEGLETPYGEPVVVVGGPVAYHSLPATGTQTDVLGGIAILAVVIGGILMRLGRTATR